MYYFYMLLIPLLSAYGAVLYANHRDNVTLSCFCASSAKYLGWYKQVAGEQPQIISSFYKHLDRSNTFYNQFKDDKRFSVHFGEGFYHLNISNVRQSDSAMYYCGQTHIAVTEFDNGTFLLLKESRYRSLIQQPVSESVQPGSSVTLNCMVQTGFSDTEHSVYWFKKDSQLGIMYVHTHRGTQCVDCTECRSPAQSCMYSLSKQNVKLSDAGTYYCAVASCGQILFGAGTKLDVGGEQHDTFPVSMRYMVAALLVSVTLNITLICIICKMAKRTHLQSGGLHSQTCAPDTAENQNEESDAMQYVALDFKKKQGKSRRQADTEKETIYSGVKVSDMK